MKKQIEKAKEFIEAKKALKKSFLLPIDLQFFAGKKDGENEDDSDNEDDDPDNEDDPEDEDDPENDNEDPSLEQLIKENPKLKKEFNALFKNRFNKRLKGVDLELAKKLIKEHTSKDDDKEDDEDKGNKKEEISAKARKLDSKLKRTAVKEYAVDNDINPKLLARLMDLDKLELDDEGEIDPDDLEELVDELTEEFPELFRKANDEDQEDDEEDGKKRSHKVGSKKKTNKPKDKDLREAGKQKALERAKKKGLIKE